MTDRPSAAPRASAGERPSAYRGARTHLIPLVDRLHRLPYWLLAAILIGLFGLWGILSDTGYRVIFGATLRGIGTTVFVSALAYVLSIAAGLVLGLMRVSRLRVVREIASFYIEIVRGVPMLVILIYVAFVGAPAIVEAVNWLSTPLISAGWMSPLTTRDFDFTARAVLALVIGYSAFIAEIFRAGIESVDRGQTEAALALGLKRGQAMRRIVLPQAVRNVLPPLGNELVAMIKDSALVSALGVQDITQLGKLYAASTFEYFETYNVVAFLYLVMTISLSMLTRGLEKRMNRGRALR